MTRLAARDVPKVVGFSDHKVEGFIEKVKALRPLLQSNALAGEKQRSPMQPVVDALREIEAFTLLLPERHGGGGLSLSGFSRIQMEVAKGDPSVSWVLQIINGTTWVASLASDAIQDTLFAKGPAPICGAYNPPGTAKRVDGGFIVNGAWPYTSGSRQAEWAQCGVLLEASDGPVLPGINMAYVPMSQITMKDTWYVTGMQGTGSDTSIAENVFVPEHMVVVMDKPYGHIEPGKHNIGAPSDNLPVVPSVRISGLAQLLGAAEAMLEIVEAESKKKPVVTTTFKTRTESAVILHDLGKVAAQLDTAKTLLLDATGLLDSLALAGLKLTPEQAGKHKAQSTQIVELIHASIETLMFISGSSAFALSNPLQRYWRDIHVGLRHVQNIPQIGYEIYGRGRLGALPNITPLGAY